MKKAKRLISIISAAALTLGLFASAFALTPAESAEAASTGSQTMYRLYNKNSGEHFYTKNEAERNNLVNVGWTYEGVGWTAPASSNTPVYRVYNKKSGLHHYTMAVGEKNSLVAAGWQDEGIGWYSDDSNRVPLYREYNKNNGQHNYTTNKSEHDYLVSIGWQNENIGWYGIPDNSSNNNSTAYISSFAGAYTCTYPDNSSTLSVNSNATFTMAITNLATFSGSVNTLSTTQARLTAKDPNNSEITFLMSQAGTSYNVTCESSSWAFCSKGQNFVFAKNGSPQAAKVKYFNGNYTSYSPNTSSTMRIDTDGTFTAKLYYGGAPYNINGTVVENSSTKATLTAATYGVTATLTANSSQYYLEITNSSTIYIPKGEIYYFQKTDIRDGYVGKYGTLITDYYNDGNLTIYTDYTFDLNVTMTTNQKQTNLAIADGTVAASSDGSITLTGKDQDGRKIQFSFAPSGSLGMYNLKCLSSGSSYISSGKQIAFWEAD